MSYNKYHIHYYILYCLEYFLCNTKLECDMYKQKNIGVKRIIIENITLI